MQSLSLFIRLPVPPPLPLNQQASKIRLTTIIEKMPKIKKKTYFENRYNFKQKVYSFYYVMLYLLLSLQYQSLTHSLTYIFLMLLFILMLIYTPRSTVLASEI